jgi:dTDP-4-amino-4,6-dideoxygalactose transaminase
LPIFVDTDPNTFQIDARKIEAAITGRMGAFGRAGCFSFQASKNLNSGEGGALLTNDADLIEKCCTFHNNGRGRKQAGSDFSYSIAGALAAEAARRTMACVRRPSG